MSINWRLVTIFPLFAVLASILSGAVGGVAVFDIVVRSVLWAIVFCGIGIGVGYVIDKFLPDLKDIMEGSIDEGQRRSSEEGGFEAFIPEENPHELEEIRQERDGGADTDEAAFFGSMDRADGGKRDRIDELADGDDAGPDFATVDSGYDDLSPAGESDTEFERGGEDDEEASVSSGATETASEDGELNDNELSFALDDGGIDKLSEFGPVDDSFSFGASASGYDSGGSFSKPHKDTKVGEFQQDPLKTAKAIHTMIQRDKEG